MGSIQLGIVAIGFITALAGTAEAQQKITLKYGWASSTGDTDPHALAAREFKRLLEANTNGRVEVQLFPNRQLGDEKPMLEGMRFGTVDMATITNATTATMEPAFQVIDLPFLFKDEAQAHEVLDGGVGQKLAAKAEAKGVKVLGYIELGFRHMVNNVRPVSRPEDIRGVKYRVMQSPLYISMFTSLGGNAVPMSWGDMFPALQQGAIDGLEVPLAIIDQNKIFEMTKFLSLTNHTYTAAELLISKRSFEHLPSDLAKAVVEAGAAATKYQRRAMAEESGKLIASLQAKGMKVNKVADVRPFRSAMGPVYDQTRGAVGDTFMKEILTAVGTR